MEKEDYNNQPVNPDRPKWRYPTQAFLRWWEPVRIEPNVGSVGGHPEAFRAIYSERVKDLVWGGVGVVTAYNCECYRQQFRDEHTNTYGGS